MKELKDFDFCSAKERAQEIGAYLAKVMNFTLVKPVSVTIEEPTANEDLIKYFVIEKGRQQPIYQQINSKRDIDPASDKVTSLTEYLSDQLYEILENNESQMDNNLIETLELMNRIVEKFIKAFRAASKRQEFDSVTIDELQRDYGRFLAKELNARFINALIPAIYTGMSIGNIDIYKLILSKVNAYLMELGISTVAIGAGEKMDYDHFSVIASDDNFTTDYKQDDTIKEVCQLPYMFEESLRVSVGQAVVWRLKQR